MTITENPAGSARVASLDGLRGLAVLAVIAVHANVLFGGETVGGSAGLLARLLGAGWIGVDLFFCLSGFLITRILWRARAGRHYFRNFYARRLLRIMPLYYAFVAVVLLVVYRLPMAAYQVSGAEIASMLLYTNNFQYAATGVAVPHLGHFWSLAVEEHFYLLWPLAVRLLARRRLMQLCLAGAALALALRVGLVLSGAWPYAAYLATPCRVDGLLLGSLVALATEDPADHACLRRALRRAALPAAAVVVAVVWITGEFTARPYGADLRLSVTLGITAVSVLFATAVERAVYGVGLAQRLLAHPYLQAIGRYSYAMYVVHCLAVSGLNWLIASRLGGLPKLGPGAGKLLAVVAVTLLSLAAALVSYRLWEKHFLKLQRYFAYESTRRPSAALPSAPPASGRPANLLPPVPVELVKC